MICMPFEARHLTQAAELEKHAPEPWSLEQLSDELTHEASYMFAACDENGKLCGFCAFQAAANEASLNAVTVRSDLRSRGIGYALLSYAISQLNADEIFLEVRTKNESAIALYKKLGFEPCGVRKGFYINPPDDAIVMRLSVLYTR